METALAAGNLASDTERGLSLVNSVAEYARSKYGLGKPETSFGLISSADAHVSFRLVGQRGLSIVPSVVRWHVSLEEAKRDAENLEKEGLKVSIVGEDTLSWAKIGPCPVLPAYASMAYDKIVEWTFREAFLSAFFSKGASAPEGFAEFAAERATTEFLREHLSPASPVLAQFISRRRDERTFEKLYRDFRSIYENAAERPEEAERRRAIAVSWIADFNLRYDSRFLTGAFKDFAAHYGSEMAMAAWRDRFGNWKAWEERFAEAGSDLSVLLKTTLPK